MKASWLILLFLGFYLESAFASSELLKQRLPEGVFSGKSASGDACIVTVSHQSSVQEPGRIYDFAVHIAHSDGQVITSYRVNDTSHIGGRGDCPSIILNTVDAIHVRNRPQLCGASPFRANFGELKVRFVSERAQYFIGDRNSRILSGCSVLN